MSWVVLWLVIGFAIVAGGILVLVLVEPVGEGFLWTVIIVMSLLYVGSVFALLKLTGRRRGKPTD